MPRLGQHPASRRRGVPFAEPAFAHVEDDPGRLADPEAAARETEQAARAGAPPRAKAVHVDVVVHRPQPRATTEMAPVLEHPAPQVPPIEDVARGDVAPAADAPQRVVEPGRAPRVPVGGLGPVVGLVPGIEVAHPGIAPVECAHAAQVGAVGGEAPGPPARGEGDQRPRAGAARGGEPGVHVVLRRAAPAGRVVGGDQSNVLEVQRGEARVGEHGEPLLADAELEAPAGVCARGEREPTRTDGGDRHQYPDRGRAASLFEHWWGELRAFKPRAPLGARGGSRLLRRRLARAASRPHRRWPSGRPEPARRPRLRPPTPRPQPRGNRSGSPR